MKDEYARRAPIAPTAPNPARGGWTDTLIARIDRIAQSSTLAPALLLLMAATSLLLANSAWSQQWEHLVHLPASVSIGDYRLEKSLLHWINDGLMGIFFFHVGLEIKREVVVGELSTLRSAALPALAALGGMVVPAALFYFVTLNERGSEGWGIPMATDIAFALGLLALLGDRVPRQLKVLLTGLAVVDDIGAVLVIALFYTADVSVVSLGIAAGLLCLAVLLNRLQVNSPLAYLTVGIPVWLAFVESGVHATIAALLMAFTIPARTRLAGAPLRRRLSQNVSQLRKQGIPTDHSLNTPAQDDAFEGLQQLALQASAPLQVLERRLGPFVSFIVLPSFALANAGVDLRHSTWSTLVSPTTLGVLLGLSVGKPLGVLALSWLGVKMGIAQMPQGLTFRSIFGVGLLAGVGFTMALFITELAFSEGALVVAAKIGIILASVLSGLAGFLWYRWGLGNAAASQPGAAKTG